MFRFSQMQGFHKGKLEFKLYLHTCRLKESDIGIQLDNRKLWSFINFGLRTVPVMQIIAY